MKAEVGPALRCAWFWNRTIFDYTVGDFQGSIDRLDDCIRIATQHNIAPFAMLGRALKAPFLAVAGDPADAEEHIREMAELADSSSFYPAQFIPKARALLHWRRGEIVQAVRWIEPTITAADESGIVPNQVFLRLDLAPIYIDVGDFVKAQHLLDEARALHVGTYMRFCDAQFAGVEAYLLLRTGKASDALERIGEALRLSQNVGMRGAFRVLGSALPVLLNQALDNDVEVEMAREIIREFSVLPPDNMSQRWPWPVKIRAFNGFDVWVRDAPLPSSGRAHYRVLALLKALVAFGPAPVSAERIADLIWPDSDGDAASSSLRTTLHRLRKLLGHEEAIRLHDGKLSIDHRLLLR